MLQELEDGVKHLLVPVDTCSGKREVLLGTWPARSQLIQVGGLYIFNETLYYS